MEDAQLVEEVKDGLSRESVEMMEFLEENRSIFNDSNYVFTPVDTYTVTFSNFLSPSMEDRRDYLVEYLKSIGAVEGNVPFKFCYKSNSIALKVGLLMTLTINVPLNEEISKFNFATISNKISLVDTISSERKLVRGIRDDAPLITLGNTLIANREKGLEDLIITVKSRHKEEAIDINVTDSLKNYSSTQWAELYFNNVINDTLVAINKFEEPIITIFNEEFDDIHELLTIFG